MVRTTFAWAIVALVAVTAGCRMCAHPYDYCGPTFTGEGCQQCMPNARAGSILSPGLPVVSESDLVPDMMVPAPDADVVEAVSGIQQPVETVPPDRPGRWASRPLGRMRYQ